jgi:SAM-dependent methyltransferase/UDP-N-acetylglucosamine transferase subunit ALG13
MSQVFVTVGMGRWPFDRLLCAVRDTIEVEVLSAGDVFVQRGTSRVDLPCESASFLGATEFEQRLRAADLVVTHAGNTVRLAQRLGHVPVVMAREAARAEMANDHQVDYLRHEQRTGRVLAVSTARELEEAITCYVQQAKRLLNERPVTTPVDPEVLARRLDEMLHQVKGDAARAPIAWYEHGRADSGNPFANHPIRRYTFAYGQLSGRRGPHLDIGVGDGEFAEVLRQRSGRDVYGVDPHPGYVAEVRKNYPKLHVSLTAPENPLPYPDKFFGSVSLLDVIEHAPAEAPLLTEAFRVLAPGGIAVITVPHWQPLSGWLDPDNAKFLVPRLHRLLYIFRYGATAYRERFADLSNGLRGDIAASRSRHTNYRTDEVIDFVQAAGFQVAATTGANLLWRLFQVPALLLPSPVAGWLGKAIVADGKFFTSPRFAANLFLRARRPTNAWT